MANEMAEMSGSQVIEVVFEGIPGTIIQLMAMFQDEGGRTAWRLLSLRSSVFSTAFISADLSFRRDASLDQRQRGPSFYGYLPNRLLKRAWTMLFVF